MPSWGVAKRLASRAPLWVLLFVPLAAWYSLLQLGSFALSDTPLAFVVLVPILAAYLLIHDSRARATSRDQSDLFFDSLIFFALFIICCILLFLVPPRLSWYYWLQRFDLLVVPIFATAIVILFWGLGGATVARRPLLYLVLIWPPPLIWLHQSITPILVKLTATFGAMVVRGLALPIAVSAVDPTSFISTGPEKFTIIISDTCSGMNAMFGFLVIGLPLVLAASGRPSRKLAWLVIGTLAALLSNLVRVGVLLYLAAATDIEFALGTIHPILGTVLFAGVFVGMLWLSRYLQVSFITRPMMSTLRSQLTVQPEGYATRVWFAGLATMVLALGQTGLGQFGPLDVANFPALPVSRTWALLPQMPDWSQEEESEINWQDLFGPDSQSRLLVYRAGEASVVVQFVATPDKGSLDTYSPEQCNWFHGERIVGVSTVNLGYGISARLVESQVGRGRSRPALNSNTLYWLMPLTANGRLYHARIALLVDTEMLPDQPVAPAPMPENPVINMQDWLNSTLSPYPSAQSRPDFSRLDAYTIAFGRQMVEAIVAGPDASVN